MSIGIWFSNLWNKFLVAFNKFIGEVFTAEAKEIIGQFSTLATLVVSKISFSGLSNEEKRALAFKEIKEATLAAGKELSSSLINTIIELALQKLKTEGSIK